jgi:hypothetical protein
MRRGYNDKAIESGFSRASEIIRNNLLALTYHPSLEKISGVVRHHSKEIEKGGTLAKCEFYSRIDIVGMFEKLIKLFIAMYPLHVNVIYKPEPCKKLLK